VVLTSLQKGKADVFLEIQKSDLSNLIAGKFLTPPITLNPKFPFEHQLLWQNTAPKKFDYGLWPKSFFASPFTPCNAELRSGI